MYFKFEDGELIFYVDYLVEIYGFKRSVEKLEFIVIF